MKKEKKNLFRFLRSGVCNFLKKKMNKNWKKKKRGFMAFDHKKLEVRNYEQGTRHTVAAQFCRVEAGR